MSSLARGPLWLLVVSVVETYVQQLPVILFLLGCNLLNIFLVKIIEMNSPGSRGCFTRFLCTYTMLYDAYGVGSGYCNCNCN